MCRRGRGCTHEHKHTGHHGLAASTHLCMPTLHVLLLFEIFVLFCSVHFWFDLTWPTAGCVRGSVVCVWCAKTFVRPAMHRAPSAARRWLSCGRAALQRDETKKINKVSCLSTRAVINFVPICAQNVCVCVVCGGDWCVMCVLTLAYWSALVGEARDVHSIYDQKTSHCKCSPPSSSFWSLSFLCF